MVEYNLYIGTGKYNKKETETLVKSLADSVLTGYTLIETNGVWKGKREDSFILQVIGDSDNPLKVSLNEIRVFGAVLREQLNQECVLLTIKKIEVEFI